MTFERMTDMGEQMIIARDGIRNPLGTISGAEVTEPEILEGAAVGKFPQFLHEAASGRTINRAPEHALEFVTRYVGEQCLPSHRLSERLDFLAGSPFQFFRALPALFVADVRYGPYAKSVRFHPEKPPAPRVLINGDSHIGNYGTFRGHDRQVVFGSNDHDQSGFGSPEEDVARLTASVVLQARALGFSESDQLDLANATVDGYTDEIRAKAKKGVRPPYFTLDDLTGRKSDRSKDDLVCRMLAGNEKTQGKFYKKYLLHTEDGWRLRVDPHRAGDDPAQDGYHRKLWPVSEEDAEWVIEACRAAIQRPGGKIKFPLVPISVAQKRFSGGSTIGLPRYYAAFEAADASQPPVILEPKQLLPCSAQTLSGNPLYADGYGVIDRQREAEQDFNPLTGVAIFSDSAYLVREREPEKDSVDFTKMPINLNQLLQYARDCAAIRARQHARTLKQACELSEWIGSKKEDDIAERRIGEFAFRYADQTQEDYQAFCDYIST